MFVVVRGICDSKKEGYGEVGVWDIMCSLL